MSATINDITPGTLVEGKVRTYRDGVEQQPRTVRVRVDRTPWPNRGDDTVLSDGKGVTSVITDSIRIIEQP